MLRVLFAATFLFGTHVFAQQSIDSIDASIASLNAQAQTVSNKIGPLQRQLDAAIVAQKAAQTAFNTAQANWTPSAGGIKNPFTGTIYGQGTGDKDLKKLRDDAQTKLDAANAQVKELQPQVTALNTQSKTLTNQVAASKATDKKANDAFVALIRSKGLVGDFNDIKASAGSVNTALDKMDAAMDKMLVGAYVKDKFSKLLNSKAICEAEKTCDPKKGGKASISEADFDAALFPDTKASDRESAQKSTSKETGKQ